MSATPDVSQRAEPKKSLTECPPLSFPKAVRLLNSADFRRVTGTGQKKTGRFFLLFATTMPGETARIGLTVSRKVGHAVVRNRVKRQMREFFRLTRPALTHGRDWVVIARPHAGKARAEALQHDLKKLFSPFERPL